MSPSPSSLAGSEAGLPRRIAVVLTVWLERHHGRVLLATALLALVAGFSFLRLRLDVDLVSMLPRGRQAFADYEQLVERFGATDVAVVRVLAPDRGRGIRFGEAFAAALAGVPGVAAVQSRVDLARFQQALLDGALPRLLPLEVYPDLERRLSPEAIDRAVQSLRGLLAVPGAIGGAAVVAADPLGIAALLAESLATSRADAALAPGQEYLLSPDGTRLLLLVRPEASGFDLEAMERFAAALAKAEETARSHTGDAEIDVAYTGAFAHAREDAALVRRDILLYTTLAFGAVLATFLVGYRDLRILPFVSGQILVASLFAFALGVLVSGRLNAVSLSFAAIFYGLSIDAVIHFYTRFVEERAAGATVPRAIEETIARLLVPVTVAALTTALAFLVIGFSELAGVAQLGLLTALGMMLNIPATLVLLPAAILWAERRYALFDDVPRLPPAVRLARLAAFSSRHRRAVGMAGLVLVLACSLRLGGAAIDSNLFHLRPPENRAAALDAELAREFGFTDPPGAVLVLGRDDGAATRDAVLAVNEAVAGALERRRGSGQILSWNGPASLLPSRATQEARLRAWAALPRAAAVARLRDSLRRAGFRPEPFARFATLLGSEPRPADATERALPGLDIVFDRYVSLRNGSIGVLSTFTPRDTSALSRIARELPREVEVPANVELKVTGRPLMERELHRTISGELVGFTAVVLLGSMLILALGERSLRAVLAILAIPAGSVVVLVTTAGLLGWDFDPVNLIVLPLVIGIGVDNGLFLSQRRAEADDPVDAVARTGRALAIVTATTVAGFGALAVSRYPALSGLGEMAALGLTLCFVATCVFLPALLSRGGATARDERSERHT